MKVVKTDKPWGYELLWATTDKYTAKILTVRKGECLSLQYHKAKDEVMFLNKGKAILQFGEREFEMLSDESYHIEPGTIHRVRALEDSEIFEISTPGEGDVVRLQNKYGRANIEYANKLANLTRAEGWD